jgi:DNA-binding SARP family transcriptional activator/predicted ATPase
VTLSIALLGAPRIEVNGEPLVVDTRKAIALLAYLAVTGHAQSRDRLTALLWPDFDDQRARAAMRRTLSTLRTALGGGWLLVDRRAVKLADDAVDIDVRQFHRLVASLPDGQDAITPLREAVALHRDDLLAGFGLRDSPEFDDWQQATAADLRRELGSALDRLTAALAEAERYAEAVIDARRWLALDRLHEPAHRRLIELLAAAGDRAGALNQYRDCVRTLDRELGVRPLPETTDLYQAVNEGRLASVPPRLSVPARPPCPLVGRERDWQVLMSAHRAAATTGQMVVVEGVTGIGKTRLAEEFLAYAASTGAQTVSARSHQGESGLAYGLMTETLRSAREAFAEQGPIAVDQRWLAEAARLAPEFGGATRPPAADGPGAQHRFVEGLVRVLVAMLSGPTPGVLLLDDLQWADPASLDVVAFLARRLGHHHLLIIAGWRTDDAPENLSRWLPAPQRIRPQRLSRDDVGQLVAAAGAPADTTDRLAADSEGLPLFVVEYLATLGEADGAPALPLGVRAVLEARLAATGETATQLLAAAAVIGRSFDIETLRDASGRGEEEVVAGVEELTTRGLIVERQHGYDFSNDKVRELVLDKTSLARTRLLHSRVSEALAARRADPALIALHHREAGQSAAAAEWYRLAAENARTLYAYTEALEHLAAALALGHPDPAGLHEMVGDVHTVRGEYGTALAAYETAAALDTGRRLAAIEQKLGRLHDRRGHWQLADRHLQAALHLGGDAARVYADRSLAAHHAGDRAAALQLAEESLRLAEVSGDAEALARAHNMVGMLTRDRSHLERSVALAETLTEPSMMIAALNNLAQAAAREGDAALALELTERALALCSRQGDRHREAALHNNLADLLHADGNADAAMTHLKQAAAGFSEIGVDEGGMRPAVWMLVEW